MPSYRDLYDFYYELKHMKDDLPDYIYHNAMNLLDGVFDRYEKDIKISKAEWKRVINRLMDVAEQCEDEEQYHNLWSFAEELGGYVGVFGLNESKLMESYVNTFVVFNTLSNTIVALCKSLEAAQQKAGSYNAYSNSSKFVGVPFTNIRHKDYTFSNDLLDKICDKFTESKMKESEETPKSFLADSIHRDPEFGYRLLGRMQSDCEYVLGACQSHGENKGALRHLWASGDPREQIACMRYIYNHLPEKPDWITEEDIDNYEKRLNELND